MAENKKSFIVYSEWRDTFEQLSNEQAGKLIKHIFSYVNDKDPKTTDIIINLAFTPIKQTLKRDLKKWERQHKQRVNAGRKSAENRKRNATLVNARSISSTVNVNGNVSVSDNVNDNITKYNKVEFLKDWNELRTLHLKKPSFLNSLQRDAQENFNQLINNYDGDSFRNALVGLFKQKVFPNGNTTMASNPRHFLSHFESYLTAYHDKNTNLYGETKNKY